MASAWAVEDAPNPSVLRVHTTAELTARTIETCPPAPAPWPFDEVLALDGVRSLDLHRYRARVNLEAGADGGAVGAATSDVLEGAWGDASRLVPSAPRGFATSRAGERVVAESRSMAAGHPLLEAAFEVPGVVEAIAGPGIVLVRIGGLFRWDEAESAVRAALDLAIPENGR